MGIDFGDILQKCSKSKRFETQCINCRTLAAETSTYASILTITAFTVERYVAICHPVKSRLASSAGLQRAVKLVIVIWIVAAVCSVPIVVQYGIVYVQVSQLFSSVQSLQ